MESEGTYYAAKNYLIKNVEHFCGGAGGTGNLSQKLNI